MQENVNSFMDGKLLVVPTYTANQRNFMTHKSQIKDIYRYTRAYEWNYRLVFSYLIVDSLLWRPVWQKHWFYSGDP